jgi:hypothetical protein
MYTDYLFCLVGLVNYAVLDVTGRDSTLNLYARQHPSSGLCNIKGLSNPATALVNPVTEYRANSYQPLNLSQCALVMR